MPDAFLLHFRHSIMTASQCSWHCGKHWTISTTAG